MIIKNKTKKIRAPLRETLPDEVLPSTFINKQYADDHYGQGDPHYRIIATVDPSSGKISVISPNIYKDLKRYYEQYNRLPFIEGYLDTMNTSVQVTMYEVEDELIVLCGCVMYAEDGNDSLFGTSVIVMLTSDDQTASFIQRPIKISDITPNDSNERLLITSWSGKTFDFGFPPGDNDTYLHRNATTGEIEWVHLSPTPVDEFNVVVQIEGFMLTEPQLKAKTGEAYINHLMSVDGRPLPTSILAYQGDFLLPINYYSPEDGTIEISSGYIGLKDKGDIIIKENLDTHPSIEVFTLYDSQKKDYLDSIEFGSSISLESFEHRENGVSLFDSTNRLKLYVDGNLVDEFDPTNSMTLRKLPEPVKYGSLNESHTFRLVGKDLEGNDIILERVVKMVYFDYMKGSAIPVSQGGNIDTRYDAVDERGAIGNCPHSDDISAISGVRGNVVAGTGVRFYTRAYDAVPNDKLRIQHYSKEFAQWEIIGDRPANYEGTVQFTQANGVQDTYQVWCTDEFLGDMNPNELYRIIEINE